MAREKIIPTASLLIGSLEETEKYIIHYLQSIYCPNNICTTCFHCINIAQKQYTYVYYVQAQDEIKIEHIDTILHMIQYKQEQHIPFFFIIPHIDFLSDVCANRLLKVLEEVHQNYHFIFTAIKENVVHATIKSRCFIYYMHQEYNNIQSPEVAFFCTRNLPAISEFYQYIEMFKHTSSYDFFLTLNRILAYWMSQYKEANDMLVKRDALKKIEYIKTLLSMEIQQGSCTIIARDLYVQWYVHALHYEKN